MGEDFDAGPGLGTDAGSFVGVDDRSLVGTEPGFEGRDGCSTGRVGAVDVTDGAIEAAGLSLDGTTGESTMVTSPDAFSAASASALVFATASSLSALAISACLAS